nr:MAG TPA: hypothetical protein [Caudoviricetes sp.]
MRLLSAHHSFLLSIRFLLLRLFYKVPCQPCPVLPIGQRFL